MEVTIKHFGKSFNKPAKIIELTIQTNSTSITEDVTNLNSWVDENLIQNLRQIASELEEQNYLLTQQRGEGK